MFHLEPFEIGLLIFVFAILCATAVIFGSVTIEHRKEDRKNKSHK